MNRHLRTKSKQELMALHRRDVERDRTRHEARIMMAQSPRPLDREAVRLARGGYGVADIVRATGINKTTATLLVTG